MDTGKRKKIVRLLGVGFDAEDGHVRITNAEKYDVLMGSEQSHEYIQQLIDKIEAQIENRGLALDDLTPEQLGEFVQAVM
ncbi:MAG: hypothetical protein DRQ56_09050 [Gammaproteobacteria bacterium]|nr:MAG: hypothetical protein DRQ56_09050 [Gammaproteobacteria bacterium]